MTVATLNFQLYLIWPKLASLVRDLFYSRGSWGTRTSLPPWERTQLGEHGGKKSIRGRGAEQPPLLSGGERNSRPGGFPMASTTGWWPRKWSMCCRRLGPPSVCGRHDYGPDLYRAACIEIDLEQKGHRSLYLQRRRFIDGETCVCRARSVSVVINKPC